MKLIVIDPTAQTVTEIDHPGQVDWRTIQHYLGGRPMTLAGRRVNGDLLWVDDEGLLNGPTNFFSYQTLNMQPLAGIGVLTGPEVNEDIIDIGTPLEVVRSEVIFLGRMEATEVTVTEARHENFTHIAVSPKIEPA